MEVTLEKGDVIYHGFRYNAAKIASNKPMFFANYDVAKVYGQISCGMFEVTGTLKLFYFTAKNVNKLKKMVPKEKKEYLERYFVKYNKTKKYEINTSAYVTKDDFVNGTYLSLGLAEIVCSLGFDGWYVPEGYMRKNSQHLFHEEVVVCKPKKLKKLGKCMDKHVPTIPVHFHQKSLKNKK